MGIKEAIEFHGKQRAGSGRPEGNCLFISLVACSSHGIYFPEQALDKWSERSEAFIADGRLQVLRDQLELVGRFIDEITDRQFPQMHDCILTADDMGDSQIWELGETTDAGVPTLVVVFPKVERQSFTHAIACLGTYSQRKNEISGTEFFSPELTDESILFYDPSGSAKGRTYALPPTVSGERLKQILLERTGALPSDYYIARVCYTPKHLFAQMFTNE